VVLPVIVRPAVSAAEEKKKRGYMVCTGDYVATNTRKQKRAARSSAENRLSPKGQRTSKHTQEHQQIDVSLGVVDIEQSISVVLPVRVRPAVSAAINMHRSITFQMFHEGNIARLKSQRQATRAEHAKETFYGAKSAK
jgi:hypothetical protein